MLNQTTENVIKEINKVVVGKEETAQKTLMAILAEGHVLLEDIPGVGKTTLALAFSKVLGLDFNRIQFTPDVVASDVVGFTMYDTHQNGFVFKQGAVMCHVLLADEINRTTSRTQSALLEVMEEKKVTVDGVTYELPHPFNVIATQNPNGSYGTQMLPQSQLDRFMIKTRIGYPDFDSQVALLRDRQTAQPLHEIKPVVTREELLRMQEDVKTVHVEDAILKYITQLTEETRQNEYIKQGVSPRGALALSKISKAHAYLNDRDYVIPEDVMAMFVDTCSHRIILNSKAHLQTDSASTLLQDILHTVEMPDHKVQAVK